MREGAPYVKMNIFLLSVSVVCTITALANAVGRCAMLETTPENVPTRQLSLKKESQERIQGKRAVSDVDRSERINRGFEKIIEFVSVLGQMNNFVYDRARNIIRKLDAIYNMDENEIYRGSHYKGNLIIKEI